ncbi:MAG: hypothetical protein HQL97_01245 [Magnetococcales bacterium]|nr:hypothetical protein [Magnetococcales bacterium]
MAGINTLLANRDSILARLATLQKSVQHGDKRVDYDLQAATTALSTIDSEIAKAGGSGKVVRQVRVNSCKDL